MTHDSSFLMKKIIRWFHQHTPTKNEFVSALNSFSKKRLAFFAIIFIIAIASGAHFLE